MGARDEAEEKIMNSSIQKYIAKATRSASNKVMSYIRSSTPSPTTVEGTNGTGNGTNFSSSVSPSSSQSHAIGSSVGGSSVSASSTPRQSRSHSKTSSSSSSSVMDPAIPSTSNSNATTTYSNVPLQSMSNDSDKNSNTSHGPSNSILEDQPSNKANSSNNNNNSNNNTTTTTTKTNKHFGVPFLIEVHRFVLQGRLLVHLVHHSLGPTKRTVSLH